MDICPKCGSGLVLVKDTVEESRDVECTTCGHEWVVVTLVIA
jgi:DNA-directed RNA polymerase subunit M/transcription elongation factor TFIIS